MSVTSELASSVQLCFVLFEVSGQADICQQDVAVIGEVAAALQPVLLRTQKAILHSDDVPEDGQLLNAVGEQQCADCRTIRLIAVLCRPMHSIRNAPQELPPCCSQCMLSTHKRSTKQVKYSHLSAALK